MSDYNRTPEKLPSAWMKRTGRVQLDKDRYIDTPLKTNQIKSHAYAHLRLVRHHVEAAAVVHNDRRKLELRRQSSAHRVRNYLVLVAHPDQCANIPERRRLVDATYQPSRVGTNKSQTRLSSLPQKSYTHLHASYPLHPPAHTYQNTLLTRGVSSEDSRKTSQPI